MVQLRPPFALIVEVVTPRAVVIRNTVNKYFELVDAETHQRLAGRFQSFAVALAAARSSTMGQLFLQVLDNRGRAMGDPWPNSTNCLKAVQ